jgi:hypothetical protein
MTSKVTGSNNTEYDSGGDLVSPEPAKVSGDRLELHEKIRRRAQEIWLERDGSDATGPDLTDWLEAEDEILSRCA